MARVFNANCFRHCFFSGAKTIKKTPYTFDKLSMLAARHIHIIEEARFTLVHRRLTQGTEMEKQKAPKRSKCILKLIKLSTHPISCHVEL